MIRFSLRVSIRFIILLIVSLTLMSCGYHFEEPEHPGMYVKYDGKLYFWESDTDGGMHIIFEEIENPHFIDWKPIYDKTLSDAITAVAMKTLADRGSGTQPDSTARAVTRAASSGTVTAYLLDFYGDLLKVDPVTDQVTAKLNFEQSIAGTAFAQGLDITPDGTLVVITVSGPGASSVLVVDLVSFSIVSTIKLSADALVRGVAITPDGKLAYVVTRPSSASGPSNVVVIDVAARQITTTISVPGFSYLAQIAMTPDGTEAYLLDGVETSEFSIPVIDLLSNSVEPPISISPSRPEDIVGPSYMALHPDGTRLYLVPLAGGPITIVSTITKTIGKIPLPPGTGPAFSSKPVFTPDGRGLFVMNGLTMIAVIDTLADTLDATMSVPPSRDPGGRRSGFFFAPNL